MILLRAKLTERRPLDVSRDAWRTITRESYRAVGAYWVQTYLPRHFAPGAASRYHYALRTKAYLLRKFGQSQTSLNARGIRKDQQYKYLRERDDAEPLVLTRHMKQQILSHVIIRGFPTRATVIMLGPAYLTTRFYKVRQPDKPKEITTVTDEERRDLGRVLRDEVTKRLNAYRAPRVTE